tara:strand:- start:469 stop:690 length:222 start_codon:yes stop_codon:yes gene_type:complete
MKRYEFAVDFTVSFLASDYETAVNYANNKYPDNNGYTTFIVKTNEIGFYPTADTLRMIHDEEECLCSAGECTA